MLLQWPAVSTQLGVISVPVQRNGPKVISATAGYSPGLASFPPTTADDGAAPAPSRAAAVADTARTRRKALMDPATRPSMKAAYVTCITHRSGATLGGYIAAMPAGLPPGPRLPKTLQTVGWWTRTVPFLEACRARYGKRFTLRLLQSPPFVHLADPADVRDVFTAPPELLHPGQGARILEPVVGANSVILLDERAHLSQRKLMLPAFHGEKMQRLSGLMQEVTEREVARGPRDEPVSLHPRLQALTLEIILRSVFGLDAGERLDALRDRLTGILKFGDSPSSLLPMLQRGRAWREFERRRAEAD